jgi:regulator of ribosome biosynthesis
MEVKQGDDPFQDPWEKQRDAKRKRVDKNMEQHMRNEERAGHLSKGTSTRILKSISASRKVGRDGGRLDVPVGVPVDLKSSGKKGTVDVELETRRPDVTRLHRGKVSTAAALRATQVSTASLGKFDKMREGEPERNNALSKAVTKKRKYESSTGRTVIATETERSLKVLKSLSDGGVAQEKDRMKGRLATGVTAFDYDYDDGLGAATFRKKKGRAGVGKMKKMTKKRVK